MHIDKLVELEKTFRQWAEQSNAIVDAGLKRGTLELLSARDAEIWNAAADEVKRVRESA